MTYWYTVDKMWPGEIVGASESTTKRRGFWNLAFVLDHVTNFIKSVAELRILFKDSCEHGLVKFWISKKEQISH